MEETVGFALARAGAAHRGRAHALLAEIGLHPGQEFLLHVLWEHDGAYPSDLSQRLGVEPATVTKMLRRLEGSGVVRREPDPQDGRRVRVCLTDQGRALEEHTHAAWRRLEAETIAALNPDERATLRALLDKVRDGLCGRSC